MNSDNVPLIFKNKRIISYNPKVFQSSNIVKKQILRKTPTKKSVKIKDVPTRLPSSKKPLFLKKDFLKDPLIARELLKTDEKSTTIVSLPRKIKIQRSMTIQENFRSLSVVAKKFTKSFSVTQNKVNKNKREALKIIRSHNEEVALNSIVFNIPSKFFEKKGLIDDDEYETIFRIYIRNQVFLQTELLKKYEEDDDNPEILRFQLKSNEDWFVKIYSVNNKNFRKDIKFVLANGYSCHFDEEFKEYLTDLFPETFFFLKRLMQTNK